MNDCYIGLGSNYEQNKNIENARKQLLKLFPNIVFAKEELTQPVSLNYCNNLFINQVAYYQTELNENKVISLLKNIEIECGRTSKDIISEIVRIDIDLLTYNDRI